MTNGGGRWRHHACHANYETFMLRCPEQTHVQLCVCVILLEMVGKLTKLIKSNKFKLRSLCPVSCSSAGFISQTCQNKFYCL